MEWWTQHNTGHNQSESLKSTFDLTKTEQRRSPTAQNGVWMNQGTRKLASRISWWRKPCDSRYRSRCPANTQPINTTRPLTDSASMRRLSVSVSYFIVITQLLFDLKWLFIEINCYSITRVSFKKKKNCYSIFKFFFNELTN